jgi:hypothetical protein
VEVTTAGLALVMLVIGTAVSYALAMSRVLPLGRVYAMFLFPL